MTQISKDPLNQNSRNSRWQRLRDIAERIQPLSPVALKLLDMSEEELVSSKDVAKIVQTDAGLAARLLRMANSSFFGLSRRISTLPDAIILLGLQSVRNLAVGVSLSSMSRRVSSTEWCREKVQSVNDHCLATAVAAHRLGLTLKPGSADELFLAGLIHDLGRIVLMLAYPDEYERLWNQVSSDGSNPMILERDRLGIDHVTALEFLGREWNLPQSLLQLVTAHHRPTTTGLNNSTSVTLILLQAANALAKVARLGDSGNPNIEIDPFCQLLSLGWSPEKLSQETERLVHDVLEFSSILNPAENANDSGARPQMFQDYFHATAQTCGQNAHCTVGVAP